MKRLSAKDIERLENTSTATPLGVAASLEELLTGMTSATCAESQCMIASHCVDYSDCLWASLAALTEGDDGGTQGQVVQLLRSALQR